jgi:hypothetical protein
MQAPTGLANAQLFVLKMPYNSSHTHRIRLILYRLISLSGHIKHSRQGTIFQSREELFEAMSKIVTAIPPETFDGVFEHWMNRLEWVSQNNGDYYPYVHQ